MADPSSYLSRDFLNDHLVQIGYVVAGVILFFVFLAATFPYAQVLSSVLEPVGLEISSRAEGFAFPLGVRMTGVTVTELAGVARRPILETDEVSVTPSLLSFLVGSPGVNLKARLYGGTLRLDGRRHGRIIAVNFALTGIQPGRLPAIKKLGVRLQGAVSATGNLGLSPYDVGSDDGAVTLSGSGITVSVVRGMAPIRLGEVHAVAKLDRGKLTIRDATSRGGDLLFSGRGVVMFEPSLPQSTVAIKFELRPAPGARRRLGFLLGLLPHPPDSTPYLLEGTIAAPSLS